MRRALTLFVVGAVLGTGLDALHVYGGVTSYPPPLLGAQAWWTPLAFGVTTLAIAGLASALRVPSRGLADLARDGPPFVAAYVFTAFAPWPSPLVGALVSAAWLAFAALRLRERPALVHALVCAVLGSAVEALVAASGAFSHLAADVAGVPWWLLPLYAFAARPVADLAAAVTR